MQLCPPFLLSRQHLKTEKVRTAHFEPFLLFESAAVGKGQRRTTEAEVTIPTLFMNLGGLIAVPITLKLLKRQSL